MEPVRMAVVGVSGWGRVLAQGAVSAGNAIISACYSPTPESRERFAAEFGGWPYPSYAEVLADKQVEAVLLATPNESHCQMIVEAAVAGKHVLVEKPITLTIPDALTAAQACAQASVVLAVGHQSRREAAVRKMKVCIASGDIGTVVSIEANLSTGTGLRQAQGSWRLNPGQVPGGPLIQIGIHHIDTMIYLLGPVNRVSSFQQRLVLKDIDDSAVVLFEFQNGAVGSMVSNYSTSYTSEIRILGTTGALIYDRHTGLELRRDLPDRAVRERIPVEPNDPIQEQVAEFAACIRQGGRPEVSAREAAAALAVVLAAVESNAQSRPVYVRELYKDEDISQ